MAITTPTLVGDGTYPIERVKPWAVNYLSDSFDAGGLNEEIKAAPTRANSALYITSVVMSTAIGGICGVRNDVAVTLVDGGGTEVLGPITLQENGESTFQKDFDPPLKITNEKALDCTGTKVNVPGYDVACFVYVEGFTGDVPLG